MRLFFGQKGIKEPESGKPQGDDLVDAEDPDEADDLFRPEVKPEVGFLPDFRQIEGILVGIVIVADVFPVQVEVLLDLVEEAAPRKGVAM